MMDRSREARRAAGIVASSSNGLSRRRHRSNSLRDSPDEDGPIELQESVRLRERVKKDRDRDRDRERDRERDRDRDRERERERERERSSRSSSKRRRGERLMIHGSIREDGGDDTSEESVNDEEDDEEEDNNNNHHINNNNNGHHNSGGVGVRLLPPNSAAGGGGSATAAASGSISNHYHSTNSNNHHHHHTNSNSHNHHHQQQQPQHLQHRKTFPPSGGGGPGKVFRAAPVWKSGDEMMGVSVPRKARSASIKRSHDWMSNNTGGNSGVAGGGGEQSLGPVSSSPVRQNLVPASAPSPAPPMSPSSSNASVRKKIKPNGPKQPRPPKSSTKASSSNPEELEIEIAEVLYGLKTQSQAPPKKEILSNESAEVNRSSSDAKSRVSSPISNSPSTNIQSSPAIHPLTSCSSAGSLSAVAPKRKRPRQISENPGSYNNVRSSPISSTTTKMEIDHTPKAEISSPNLEKAPGSEAENGYDSANLVNSLPSELPLPELIQSDSEVKAAAEGLGECRDVIPKESISSPRKESPAVKAEGSDRNDAVTVTALASVTKATSAETEVNAQKEEKFQIDLEAPPPQLRSSPERESEINLVGSAMDHKPDVTEEMKPVLAKDKEDEKVVKKGKEEAIAEEKKAKLAVEASESQKRVENKVRNIDLQLDLEKPERDSGISNKLPQQGHKQPQPQPQPSKAVKDEPHGEKPGLSGSLPLPMSMASWPGGLPPMGYMGPIQGVVSMDGSTVSPAPIQPFFSQPRPKRCATHCYIARNINCYQQFMKMNPFWPAAAAAASSASLFGSKPLSVVPPADLHGNIAGRAVNSAQEKAQGLAIFQGHGGKDKSSQPTNMVDSSQRKQQILLQQALPTVAPNNILHGPAFIFPLNQQQQAAVAASARPGSIKPPTTSGNVASTSASNSAAASSSAAGGAATAVSFNYPNMPANETQYLAILQNNAYPFPIPAAVGAPPNYRGAHPQALPMFNGSFYSSQLIHPSQLQQPQQAVSQSQQMQQNPQNSSMSSGSSSSQKHLQGQQQRSAGSTVGGNGSGNLHNFPAPKSRQSQPSQPQQSQQITPSQARQLENEVGAEDSPSTADSRGARAPVNIYGQNFAMPTHLQNYALLATPAGLANSTATTSSSIQSDKKQQQQPQQQGKNGVEQLPPQTFAMSFASINGSNTAPGFDLSSMAHNHAILQSLPEATRHNIQIMAATAAAQAAQRKNFRICEEGKTGGGDSSNTEDERKGLSGKPPANSGQSIAFSRSELTDASGSATATSNVMDSSARSLNLGSAPAWTARATIANSLGAAGVSNAQLQAQHQPQQMIQLHKQQQQLAAASAACNKTPATSNGSVYPEHLSSTTSMAGKFPNSLSAFPQNLVQASNGSSPQQSPQWRSSVRTNTSQAPSSFVTSTTSLKSLPQQQSRTQQSHTQISFGANQKSSAAPSGQQAPSSIQSPSSPMMVGSPSTSSISKGASGSPRTNSASASTKTGGQASSLATQQAKNSSVPGQKSSPVGGRNVPSILGNPHIVSTSNSGPKSQLQQQQQQLHQLQQQQLPKNMQQAQLFFSNPYVQSQSPHSTNANATTASGGYYIQRRRPDQQQQPQTQQPPGSSAASSTGMLTLCPVSLAGVGTSDPAKAIAAATVAASNMKGGVLPSQSILHAQFAAQSAGNQHQLLPAGFPYVQPVPAAVHVKPAEQKQPAGNDNLHACWQPEKK